MDESAVGPYRLLRLLGRGGMGEVHLAEDTRLGRKVALKILAGELAPREEFRGRFLREARSVSALSHPNITTVYDVGSTDELYYIALEHVEGETLESWIARRESIALDQLLEIAIPVAEAMDYAHRRGVVHRDLKPANILLSDLGIPKILDFGLAKIFPEEIDTEGLTAARLTQAGVVVGTIAYMSPEQALGGSVDRRTDVFSFGALLYELACGQPPFSGATSTQILDGILHGEPVPLDRVRPDLPAELSRVTAKALRKDPDERYQHMSDLAADLRHLSREGVSSSRTLPAPAPPVRRGPPRRAAWAIGAFAALAALAVAFGLWMAEAPSGRGSVAVMYFENLSDPSDAGRTGVMLAHLLSTELAGSEDLEVVSGQTLHDVAKRLGRPEGLVDRTVASEVARRADVGTMVVGKVARMGDRIVATAELVDVASGRSIAFQRVEGSAPDDVFAMAAELGRKVREELSRSQPSGQSPVLTASVEAYRAYVEGESFLQRADLEAAAERFEESVRIDPEFALAHFRLSIAARWLSDGVLAHQEARRALALLDRVPAELRPVVRANALYQEGAYSEAIPLLESVLEEQPDSKEALYLLSQIYVHSTRDNDVPRAVELMENLLALDPEFHLVYDRLALAYAFLGDLEKARERTNAWREIRPDKVEGLLSVLATLEGQPEEALAFDRAFTWIEGPLFQAGAAMLASQWDLARRIVDYDPNEWRSDHLRAWALRNRAVFHTYVGEFDRAVELFRQAGTASGFRTDEGTSGGVAASALQALAEILELQGETAAALQEAERALRIQSESARSLYYAGRFAARDGDLDPARGHRKTLSRIASRSGRESARIYWKALDAEIALADGDAETARGHLEEIVGSGKLLIDWASTCSSAGASLREALARAYLALGRTAEAARAYEALLASGCERLDHPVLYVRGLYQLGKIRWEAGDHRSGRRLLERFLSHWGEADWEIAEIDDARALLGTNE